MKILYAPLAAADLKTIFDYIQERHPSGAENVKRAIHASIELLAQFPYMGVRTDLEPVRMLVVPGYPYLIFYVVNEKRNEISVISVRHAARER